MRDKEEIGIVGKHGLGDRNQVGERLIDFCAANNLFITNTFLQQPKRRHHTWILPNRLYINQIDYILCSKRRRSAVQVAKTVLGADCGIDHQLLVTKLRIKLKAKANISKVPARFNVEDITRDFLVEVKNRLKVIDDCEKCPNELWEDIRGIVQDAANKHLIKRKPVSLQREQNGCQKRP